MAQDQLDIKQEHMDYEVPLLPLITLHEGIESTYDPIVKQEEFNENMCEAHQNIFCSAGGGRLFVHINLGKNKTYIKIDRH